MVSPTGQKQDRHSNYERDYDFFLVSSSLAL